MTEDEHLPRSEAAFERLGDQAAGLDTASARRAIEQRSHRRRQGLGAVAVASAAVVAVIAFVVVGSDDPDQDVATPVSSTASVPSTEAASTDLDGTAWILASGTGPSGEIPIVDGSPNRLTFDGTQIRGTAACILFGGDYRLEGASLTIEGLDVASADCEPETAMASAEAFLAALGGVDRVTLSDDFLTMSGPSVELVFLAPPAVHTDELVGQRWVLDTLIVPGASLAPAGDPATLHLHPDGTFDGSTGCRSLSGDWTISGVQVRFVPLRMEGECPNELKRQDSSVVGALGDDFTVEIDDDRLIVSSQTGISLRYGLADEIAPVTTAPSAPTEQLSIQGFLDRQAPGDEPVDVSGHLVNRGGSWVLCETARLFAAVGHFCDSPWVVITNYDRIVDAEVGFHDRSEEALALAEANPDFTVDDGIVWTPEPITLTLAVVEGDPLGRVRAAVSGWPTDAELAPDERRLVAAYDAIDGSDPIDVGPLRLAESGVQLGLSNDLVVTRTPDELTDPAAWTLEREMFRGREGRFSALELLAGPLETAALAGAHGHCASPPQPVHPDLQGLRQLSLQPVDIDTCLRWFTVDLYLDEAGDVAGITLDVWEP